MALALRVYFILLCLTCVSLAAPNSTRVRVSSWYWLNSVPKTGWRADFDAMKHLGLTDVVLVWGLDATAFSTRIADSHEAIRAAHRAGLGSYLFVWHARHSALPHELRFEQVDAAGQSLYAFDAFDPEWRNTQWKQYLQTVAREYGPEPGMAGYVFDNSFAVGRVGAIDGPMPAASDSYISYGDAERRMFGKPLPVLPQDPAWAEWTQARQQWWAEWASDTRKAIRAIDADPRHKIILEDGDNTIDPDTESRVGLSLKMVIPFFDTMGAYWATSYADPTTEGKLAGDLEGYLTRMRTAIGSDKELSLSLRISDAATEDTPGHADKPTVEQIKQLVDAAVAMGVRKIDFYGYRMGIYHLDGPGWRQYQPGNGPTYPLTGQIKRKFLVDRPELFSPLRSYLLQIEAPGR
jgi:hypothetical protein